MSIWLCEVVEWSVINTLCKVTISLLDWGPKSFCQEKVHFIIWMFTFFGWQDFPRQYENEISNEFTNLKKKIWETSSTFTCFLEWTTMKHERSEIPGMCQIRTHQDTLACVSLVCWEKIYTLFYLCFYRF